jgi:hypothetical protein
MMRTMRQWLTYFESQPSLEGWSAFARLSISTEMAQHAALARPLLASAHLWRTDQLPALCGPRFTSVVFDQSLSFPCAHAHIVVTRAPVLENVTSTINPDRGDTIRTCDLFHPMDEKGGSEEVSATSSKFNSVAYGGLPSPLF